MQTEQFDDHLRKKLLAAEPAISEDEVNRIYNHISAGGKITPGVNWARLIVYGVAATVLMMSLTFNWLQSRQNGQLMRSLKLLGIQAANDSIALARQQQSPPVRITEKDTVYIERILERQVPAAYEKFYASPSERVDSPSKGAGILPDSIKQNDVYVQAAIPAADAENAQTTALQVNNNAPATNLSDLAPAGSQGHRVTAAQKQLLQAQLRALLPAEFQPTLPDLPSLTIPPYKMPVSVTGSVPNSRAKSQIRWQDLHYYAGAGFDAGKNLVGASVLGEIGFGPRWRVQAGLRWQEITGQRFYTAEQYKQQTGQDFRALYAPYVAAGVDLLNIEQLYEIFQAPVQIAYLHPVAPNWALRFGLGTELTIYSSRQIHFDYRENSVSFDQGDFEAPLKVPVINNITAQIGVQRDWKRLIFRVSPYGSYQVSRVPYADNRFSAGVRLQAFYRIK